MITKVTHVSPETGTSSDSETIIQGSTTIGSDDVLLTADMSVKQLLEQILIQLKIMNLRDEAVTGETVSERDIV